MLFGTKEYDKIVNETESKNKGFKRVHNNMIELYEKFYNVCNENGIKPSAAFGTAIGALRHEGPVPWDDDIDVLLLPDELDKILKLKKEFKKVGLKITSPARKRSGYSIWKVRPLKWNGSFVDLFVCLPYSKESNLSWKFRMHSMTWASLAYIKLPLKPRFIKHFFEYLITPLTILLPANLIFNSARKWSEKLDTEDVLPFAINESADKYLRNKKDFNNRTRVRFGNSHIYVLDNEEKYLNSLFGDFTKFPNIKHQKPGHKNEW